MRDHSPPQFHAQYGEYEALLAVDDLEVIRGRLPVRAHRLVIEWASEHHDELRRAWNLVEREEPPGRIAPLP